jgi:hypothetical protein
MIAKTVTITQCYQCPHQCRKCEWNSEVDSYTTTGATCTLSDKPLEFKHYCGYELIDAHAFPDWCELPNESEEIPEWLKKEINQRIMEYNDLAGFNFNGLEVTKNMYLYLARELKDILSMKKTGGNR